MAGGRLSGRPSRRPGAAVSALPGGGARPIIMQREPQSAVRGYRLRQFSDRRRAGYRPAAFTQRLRKESYHERTRSRGMRPRLPWLILVLLAVAGGRCRAAAEAATGPRRPRRLEGPGHLALHDRHQGQDRTLWLKVQAAWRVGPEGHLSGQCLERERPVLMVDGGDLFGAAQQERPASDPFLCEVTGDLGFDAIGLGERDLNYGLEFLREMIDKYDLPFTNANVRDAATRRTDPAGVPGGRDAAASSSAWSACWIPTSKIITMTSDDERLRVDDPVATLRELLPRMREEADTIVLLGHLGDADHREVIKEVKGIDICVVGHTYREPQDRADRRRHGRARRRPTRAGTSAGPTSSWTRADGQVMAVDVEHHQPGRRDRRRPGDAGRGSSSTRQDLVEFKEAKRAAYPRDLGSEKEKFLGDRACKSCHEDAWAGLRRLAVTGRPSRPSGTRARASSPSAWSATPPATSTRTATPTSARTTS